MAVLKSHLISLICYCISLGAANPLETRDQHELDTLAVALHNEKPYEDIKVEAAEAFKATAHKHGYETESQAIKDALTEAIEELGFGAMQKAVNRDQARPKVYRLLAPPRTRVADGLRIPGGRYAYDNPDAIYRTIPISGNYSYIIHGQRTGAGPSDMTFSLNRDVTNAQTLSVLTNEDLEVQPDGHFTITVNSTASSSPNHIQSNPDVAELFIRNNIGDWLVEIPDMLDVEVIEQGGFPDALSNETIIELAREYFTASISPFADLLLDTLTMSNPVNELPSLSQSLTLGTLTTQASSLGHFNLTSSEAIIVRLNPGPATYWVFPRYTPWMITENTRNQLESWNSKQAVANTDGSYTMVLSVSDPGVANWVNATAYGQGTIMARFQGLPLTTGAVGQIDITSQLTTLDKLSEILGDEFHAVSAEERADQVKARQAGYDAINSH